jgi:simple sugar transport system permease protein
LRLRIEPRLHASRRFTLIVTLLSALLALPFISIIFFVYGVNPILALSEIIKGAFGDLYSISETITKSIPLMLIGVGLALAFETLFYNIGAEGQLLMGAIFGSWGALTFTNSPAYIIIPTMFFLGFLGGALWGVIPSLLKIFFRANEVITTLMLNYIAIKILEYLVYGPWRGEEVWGFPYTSRFQDSAILPTIGASRIHYHTLVIAICSAIAIYVLTTRMKTGLEIRIVGKNPDAASYLGISYSKIILFVMFLSSGLAGLAGVGEVAGIHHRLRLGISPGYGFTAIIVAWLSRLNPFTTILVAVLFGGLLVGGEMIQVTLGLPFGITQMFNGVFLLSILSGEFLLRTKIRIESGKG